MPKRRAPASLSQATTTAHLTDAQVEAFAAGADQQDTPPKLDPKPTAISKVSGSVSMNTSTGYWRKPAAALAEAS